MKLKKTGIYTTIFDMPRRVERYIVTRVSYQEDIISPGSKTLCYAEL